MNWNNHSRLEGKHAYLSASKSHWVRYTDEHFVETFKNEMAKQRGTELHELACKCINMKIKLPKNNLTLNQHVNDAIGLHMDAEKVLYYSENCFGTADAISFKNNVLRIHDLKTGVGKVHMTQLYVYAALFCLEYGYKPGEIKIICRIYQNNEVLEDCPNADDILPIMDKIIHFDKMLNKLKEEV